jgi:hypothetical protein
MEDDAPCPWVVAALDLARLDNRAIASPKMLLRRSMRAMRTMS